MGPNRSTLHFRRTIRGRVLAGLSRALGVGLLAASFAWGQEVDPAPSTPQEPQILPAPVQLIPVEEAAASNGVVAPVSAPAVRLAPEPLPLQAKKAKQITNAVEGIRAASFKDLTPGESTRQDVLGKLGEPQGSTSRDGEEKLDFVLGPFPSVQVTLVENVVTSIVIHLATATAQADVVKELQLEAFRPVEIRDDGGHLLGEVYPERALMFAYEAAAGEGEEPKVGQVVLERVSVEPFLLRVQQIPVEQITKRLADLHTVAQLAPGDPEAFILAARLDEQCGRVAAALDAATKAVALDATKTEYRLVMADAQRQLGQFEEASETVHAVLKKENLSPLDEAEMRFIYGRLLAATPTHDYKQGMQETVTAIKLAAAQVSQGPPGNRPRARQLLVRAELSLAEILAYGPWKQKHEVVPQWLASAEKVANEHIEKDGASRAILLSVYSGSLHCLLILEGQGTPDKIADAAIQLGRDLIAQSDDEDFQALVEWRLGTGLWYAAQVSLGQGQPDQSLQLANNAEALMIAASHAREDSAETQHHLAQLHFLMGSIYALHKGDHATATNWYDKAMPQLAESFPDSLVDERGILGERLVSVGISLWESNRKNQAISVTEEGVTLINKAVSAGTFKEVALAVPYHNLAEMHRTLGNEEQAQRMARKAAQYEPAATQPKKRR